MYDYFKLDISYLDFSILQENKRLQWSVLIDQGTGEILPIYIDRYKKRKLRPEKVAFYKGLYFERYNKRENNQIIESYTFICGSLHVFYNGGNHNYNQYNLQHHKIAIEVLKRDFGIIPKLTRINHIEIATLLNNLNYSVSKIINNLLVQITKGAKPKQYNIDSFYSKSEYKKAKRKQYSIKCYAKHLQFDLDHELLKFEVKYYRMERLNKLGFYNLAQTVNPKYIKLLHRDLLKRWNETMIYDWTIDKTKLSKRQIINLKDYCNPSFWKKLNSQSRYYHLKKYKTIVSKHSSGVHSYINEMIKDNSHNLTVSVSTQDSHNLTNNIVSASTILIHKELTTSEQSLCLI
jgi:hypothetical protein